MGKRQIKNLAGAFIRYGGLFFLFKKLIFKNRVSIVLYHNPNYHNFDKHIQFYLKHFNIIPLKAFVERALSGKFNDLPPYSLIITIDDGYRGNYSLLPIFKKYKIEPTIFVCSKIVGTNRKFWFDIVGDEFEVYEKMERVQRNQYLNKKYNFTEKTEYSQPTALSVHELKELDKYADVQSHSLYHPILTNECGEKIVEEIEKSKIILEDILSKKICHFSYPNGSYSEGACNALKNAGYISARTCDIGWNSADCDLFKLKGLGLEDSASLNILCGQITGIFGWVRLFAKKIRNKRIIDSPFKSSTASSQSRRTHFKK